MAPQTRTCAQDRARRAYAPGKQAVGPQRSISRIKHDLHRKPTQSAQFPAKLACGRRAQRLPRRTHVPRTGRAGYTRLGTRPSVRRGRYPEKSTIYTGRTDKVRTPWPMRRVAAAPSGSPDAPMCPGQGAQDIRAWEPGHRSVEVALLTFRVWHACARCHRNKKNLHAMLRSSSELVSLSDHLRLLVACRPRARVIRACAVSIARRGAQI